MNYKSSERDTLTLRSGMYDAETLKEALVGALIYINEIIGGIDNDLYPITDFKEFSQKTYPLRWLMTEVRIEDEVIELSK